MAQLGLAQIGAAWPNSAGLGSGLARPESDLSQLGLARLCSAWFGPARFASAQVGLAQPGLAQIGSGWLDSTRSEDVSNFFPLCFRMVGWRGKSLEFIVKTCVLAKIPDGGFEGKKVLQMVVLGPSGAASAWPGSARLSLAWPSSAWLRSAQLGPARPGSARA